ncbi:hypothetical protein HU720_07405 [Pseudomonas sp. SWRI51]|uniref:DUF6392 family protein n=1 Tax=Pseudomonas sp. SWRI51 TaxID=2745491 RepID=UPI00164915CF|nr:hypothetical protein [Pseudomonas sp. SWRI51]MBC3411127.1 hypothetical protein [Pseudomonas sp. SWRI51]
MGVLKLDTYLGRLGRSYDELVMEGLLPPNSLQEIYDGSLTAFYEPDAGIELEFWAQSRTFEKLHITLAPDAASSEVFEGKVEKPFGNCSVREEVLQVHGEPATSKGPFEMPRPLGESGGWDIYCLKALGYEGVNVVFKYDVGLNVVGFTFSLEVTSFDKMLVTTVAEL